MITEVFGLKILSRKAKEKITKIFMDLMHKNKILCINTIMQRLKVKKRAWRNIYKNYAEGPIALNI